MHESIGWLLINCTVLSAGQELPSAMQQDASYRAGSSVAGLHCHSQPATSSGADVAALSHCTVLAESTFSQSPTAMPAAEV